MFRAALIAVALLTAAPLGAQPAEWVHLEITEAKARPTRVRLTLPVSAIVRALPHAPDLRLDRCRLSVGDERVAARELAAILRALNEVEPGTVVRRETPDVTIEARREGEEVRLWAEGGWRRERVSVSMPHRVATALASGRAARLEIAAALHELAARGGGELALVAADDTRVRLWVDRSSRPEEE